MRAVPRRIAATAWIVLVLPGCNGLAAFLNAPTTPPGADDQSAVGVWSGTDTLTGLAVTAVVGSTGQGAFLRADWVQFAGTAAVTGTSLSVTVNGFANFGTTFSDGTSTGATVSIDGIGDLNSQNPTTGCVQNGTISTAGKTLDIHQFDFTFKSCTGAYTALNDAELSGLAVLNTDVSPAQLVIAVTGSSSSGQFGITSYLDVT